MPAWGDPEQLHYGEPSHFLQVPLARAIWRVCETIGLPVSLEAIFVGLSLAGTLAAIVCVGLIAAETLRTRAAAWLTILSWPGEAFSAGRSCWRSEIASSFRF